MNCYYSYGFGGSAPPSGLSAPGRSDQNVLAWGCSGQRVGTSGDYPYLQGSSGQFGGCGTCSGMRESSTKSSMTRPELRAAESMSGLEIEMLKEILHKQAVRLDMQAVEQAQSNSTIESTTSQASMPRRCPRILSAEPHAAGMQPDAAPGWPAPVCTRCSEGADTGPRARLMLLRQALELQQVHSDSQAKTLDQSEKRIRSLKRQARRQTRGQAAALATRASLKTGSTDPLA
eukprot:3449384-Pleurochrysis_carterae.AAC.2